MRKTKRNIARKTKAAKANRIPAKTEPFALAEGHTVHSETTEPPQTSTSASANGESVPRASASGSIRAPHVSEGNTPPAAPNSASKSLETSQSTTEPFASAEGPGSLSTNAAPPLSQSSHGAQRPNGFVPQSRHQAQTASYGDTNATTRQTEPFALAEGPGSLFTNTAPPLSQFRQGAHRPNGFVPQSRHQAQTASYGDADATTRQTEPFALAEGPGSPSTNDVPPLSQFRQSAHRPDGFVHQRTGLSSSADSAAGTLHLSPRTSDGDPRAERNRQNAQRSTGPRTPEGKAASSQNALKHGLSLQRHAILEHEDPADYEQLLAELREIYEPQSRREDLSVEDVAQCRWALRRFDEAEVKLLDFHFARSADPKQDPRNLVSYGESLGYACIPPEPGDPADPEYPSLLLLQRYRAHWDRRHQRAIADFDRARRDRRQEASETRKQAEALRKAAQQDAEAQRKQELHELRIALAHEKLGRERQRHAKAGRAAEDQALHQALEHFLQSPPPGLADVQLGSLGFVSSPELSELTLCCNPA